MKNYVLCALLAGACSLSAVAQVTERERPAEWENLVEGARFMDRIQPMKGKVLSADVWGADSVRPRYVDNGIESPNTSYWGGNILKEPDGKYHLFVCGWPENSPEGHMFWRNSTVFHAVSDMEAVGERVPMTFIRAPYIVEWGSEVMPLAFVDARCVAARQGNQLVTAFHPELDDDERVHRYFVERMCQS